MQWISVFYLLVIAFIMLVLFSKISGEKDDTGYMLDFYSHDIAYGVERMLWAEGDVSYVYLMEEGFDLEVGGGDVLVRKDKAFDTYKYRPHEKYGVKISKQEDGFLIEKVIV